MTRAEARALLLQHLTEALGRLPAGSVLARRHPDLPAAVLHGGVTRRLDPDLLDVEEPDDVAAVLNVAYWVVGATPENSDRYFDLVLDAWRERGRQTRADRDTRPRAGFTRTSDGCGLTATQSVNGYLSLSGSTPPFAAGPDDGGPLPPRIDRPN